METYKKQIAAEPPYIEKSLTPSHDTIMRGAMSEAPGMIQLFTTASVLNKHLANFTSVLINPVEGKKNCWKVGQDLVSLDTVALVADRLEGEISHDLVNLYCGLGTSNDPIIEVLREVIAGKKFVEVIHPGFDLGPAGFACLHNRVVIDTALFKDAVMKRFKTIREGGNLQYCRNFVKDIIVISQKLFVLHTLLVPCRAEGR